DSALAVEAYASCLNVLGVSGRWVDRPCLFALPPKRLLRHIGAVRDDRDLGRYFLPTRRASRLAVWVRP
ncbi:hypothetical protein, partial [Burkholderia sp. E168m23]|uniref:hypothetical protein n=1 Tax=Burkholderia sp. E168m23 TaxID=1561200 RepID=UPI0035A8B106